MTRRGVLPEGAGAVRCTVCGAAARADGKGTPIVARHDPTCSEPLRIADESLDELADMIDRARSVVRLARQHLAHDGVTT